MAKVETEILNQSELKPLIWKRYIDDIFSLWTLNREEIMQFPEQANKHHSTVNLWLKFQKQKRYFWIQIFVKAKDLFRSNSVLDGRKLFKPTETFQYTHFSSCHPPRVKKDGA